MREGSRRVSDETRNAAQPVGREPGAESTRPETVTSTPTIGEAREALETAIMRGVGKVVNDMRRAGLNAWADRIDDAIETALDGEA